MESSNSAHTNHVGWMGRFRVQPPGLVGLQYCDHLNFNKLDLGYIWWEKRPALAWLDLRFCIYPNNFTSQKVCVQKATFNKVRKSAAVLYF